MKPTLWLLPVTVLLLASCESAPARRSTPPPASAVAVRTAVVCTEDWPATYEATGTVRARTTATISSKVMAYVQQVSARVGDHVRQGEGLIVLDSQDLNASLLRAQAARTEAESAIPELENATAAAKANLDLAQSTFQRMQELAAKKSISNQEFDEAQARLKAAVANYEMMRARRTQLNSKIAGAGQEVRAAGIMRDYTRLAAPFQGVVISRTIEPGNLATPGAPLLTIEQDGAYRLETAVDESKWAGVTVGQPVDVAIEAAGRTLAAHVAEFVPSVDPASRTLLVKLDLPAARQLRTGMFGRALFPLGMQKVVAVPVAALMERGQLQSVMVVEDGVTHTRLVTAGRRTGDSVEVLSGLNAGEAVVLAVPAGLQDGARVEVRR
jgi:RND family efflux transporter MFP subunit